MLRIGNREVVHVETFILPEDEDALLEFSTNDVQAKLRIRFEQDLDSKDKTSFEIEPDPIDEERGLLTFRNWNRPDRVMNRKPSTIMTNGEKNITLLISSNYTKNKYHVTMQFMLEEANEHSS